MMHVIYQVILGEKAPTLAQFRTPESIQVLLDRYDIGPDPYALWPVGGLKRLSDLMQMARKKEPADDDVPPTESETK